MSKEGRDAFMAWYDAYLIAEERRWVARQCREKSPKTRDNTDVDAPSQRHNVTDGVQ